MNIGKAIRSIRKDLNIPQKKMALDCGLTQTYLSQIETGIKIPSDSSIRKICKAMDVPEILIYIVAMQEEKVPASKHHVYGLIQPSITNLALQLLNSSHVRMVRKRPEE